MPDPYADVSTSSFVTDDGIGLSVCTGLGGNAPWVLVRLSAVNGGRIPIPLSEGEVNVLIEALQRHLAEARAR